MGGLSYLVWRCIMSNNARLIECQTCLDCHDMVDIHTALDIKEELEAYYSDS